jgi:hypothetical protein
MKKKLFIICFAVFLFRGAFGQDLNIGITAAYLIDNDLNKPLKGLIFPIPQPTQVLSVAPISFGLIAEKKYEKISPSVGINLVRRNLRYSEYHTDVATFSHHTLEIPLNLTYRKSISNDAAFLALLGGGAGHSLTPAVVLGGFSLNNTPEYELTFRNKNGFTGFLSVGAGIENKIKNAGNLQVKVQYLLQMEAMANYSVFYSSYTQTTTPFRLNYASLNFIYFPFKK